MRSLAPWFLLASLSFACGPAGVEGEDDLEVEESELALTPAEATAVLGFLNGSNATIELLKGEIGVTTRAATNIYNHVRGRDGRLGTRDDDRLDSIAELDRIAYVGPATITKLRDYADRTGLIQGNNGLVIEGVPLTESLGRMVLECANGASSVDLDLKADLDARAANAIVAARPIGTLPQLAAVSYVGRAAIERLRDYAPSCAAAPQCAITLVGRAARDVAVLSEIIDAETTRDYPWSNLAAFQLPTCLDWSSESVQAELGARFASLPLGWATTEAPRFVGFNEGGVTFLDMLADSREVVVDRSNGEALNRHPDLDTIVARIRADIDANPSAFREVILQTDAEECSELTSALIDTRNGAVITFHRFPRC